MNPAANHRTGFIAIVGRPNVGKSTLLNHLLQQKLSITSSKPQTTRHKITGILSDKETQYIFVDTPGYQIKYPGVLNKALNRTVNHALADADLILLLVEAMRFSEDDQTIINLLPDSVPVILVVSKIDEVKDKKVLLPFIDKLAKQHAFRDIVPLSATKNLNLDTLFSVIRPLLPEGPPMFAAGQHSDQPPPFFAAEIIREKIFRLLRNEIPYSVNVIIDEFKVVKKVHHIQASIWVDKASQKAIIIGKQGLELKLIGTRARKEMEKLFGTTVYLQLWVKVKAGWSKDVNILHSLGYHD